MKPFDLKQAMNGHPIVTRGGRKAAITAVLNTAFFFRVHAIIWYDIDKVVSKRFTEQGKEFGNGDSDDDLYLAE